MSISTFLPTKQVKQLSISCTYDCFGCGTSSSHSENCDEFRGGFSIDSVSVNLSFFSIYIFRSSNLTLFIILFHFSIFSHHFQFFKIRPQKISNFMCSVYNKFFLKYFSSADSQFLRQCKKSHLLFACCMIKEVLAVVLCMVRFISVWTMV